jgi:hypothetical protein
VSLEPGGCEQKCQKGPERHNETIAVSVPSMRWAKQWDLLSILRGDLLEGVFWLVGIAQRVRKGTGGLERGAGLGEHVLRSSRARSG